MRYKSKREITREENGDKEKMRKAKDWRHQVREQAWWQNGISWRWQLESDGLDFTISKGEFFRLSVMGMGDNHGRRGECHWNWGGQRTVLLVLNDCPSEHWTTAGWRQDWRQSISKGQMLGLQWMSGLKRLAMPVQSAEVKASKFCDRQFGQCRLCMWLI